jgi:hypothetical protein
MTDDPQEDPASIHRHHRVDLLAAVLLAVAAVATAWSTYQSTSWRGVQAQHTARSTAAHIAAAEISTRAGQLTQVDISTFEQWIDAEVGEDPELADFYRERMRAEFRPAFDAWLATDPLDDADAPSTPFELPEYRLAETERADAARATAVAESATAAHALDRADHYMLGVVVFATALFFAGISTKFRSVGRRELLVGCGYALLIGGAAYVLVLAVID